MINLITLENIYKNFNSSNFSINTANLKFTNNNINVITGPNGSGKTTLLNLISLIDKPDKGRILFDGTDVIHTNNGKAELREDIGFVTQRPYLFNMDVAGNIALGLKIRKCSEKEISSKVDAILKTLKISHLKHRSIRKLSGGEYQKVAIAQVLVFEPKILLLDEPTAGIDVNSASLIEETIKNIQKNSQMLVIMTTHSLNQAYRMSPNIVSIANGRIVDFVHENVFSGELKNHPSGLKSIKVANDVEITLATEKSGSVYIAIDPEDIILSKQMLETSARNCFSGKVSAVESAGLNVRLLIDIGVNIYVVITKKSFDELGINLGSTVFVNFKVNSVKVI